MAPRGSASSPQDDPQTAMTDSPDSPAPEPQTADLPGWGNLPDPPPGPAAPDVPEGGSVPTQARLLTTASFKGKAAAYSAIAKALLTAAGGVINSTVAKHDEDESFLPDADDLHDIPAPIGRLAARRIPIGDGSENFSDLADIGQAVVGILAYTAKGAAASMTARRELRRAAKKGATFAPDLDEGQGQDDGTGWPA